MSNARGEMKAGEECLRGGSSSCYNCADWRCCRPEGAAKTLGLKWTTAAQNFALDHVVTLSHDYLSSSASTPRHA